MRGRVVTRTAKKGKKKSRKSAIPQRIRSSVTGAGHRMDKKLDSPGDWRADILSEIRRLIHEAVPNIIEERKWVKRSNPLGVPVWSCGGIVCTGETYKAVVKLTFARGAFLNDPHGLFNASLEGSARRAIDIREGELPNAAALKRLIQAAVAENQRPRSKKLS